MSLVVYHFLMIQVFFEVWFAKIWYHFICITCGSNNSWSGSWVDNFNPKKFFNGRLWNSYVLYSSIESIKSPQTVRWILPLSSCKTPSRNLPITLDESISFILGSHLTVARMSKMPVFCALINDTFWKCLLSKLKLTEFVLSIVLPREKTFHFEFLKDFCLF